MIWKKPVKTSLMAFVVETKMEITEEVIGTVGSGSPGLMWLI